MITKTFMNLNDDDTLFQMLLDTHKQQHRISFLNKI